MSDSSSTPCRFGEAAGWSRPVADSDSKNAFATKLRARRSSVSRQTRGAGGAITESVVLSAVAARLGRGTECPEVTLAVQRPPSHHVGAAQLGCRVFSTWK